MRFLWLLLGLTGVYGLTENYRYSTPQRRKQMFIFYTNLSNLAVTVYFLLLAFLPGKLALHGLLLSPICHMAAAWSITVTFLIYHFVLSPSIRKLPETDPEHIRYHSRANRLVHYVMPLSTFAEWLFFAEKSAITLGQCSAMLLIPLLYTVFLFIRPHLGGHVISGVESFYPYPFLDVDVLGRKKVIRNCLGATAALYLLAVIFRCLALFFSFIS